jgi:RimJ/RimL family protein N-acetyltransferase
MTGDALRPVPAPGPIRTQRLVLRCWQRDDAPLVKDAIDSSLDELRLWMPWARSEPSPLESIAQRIEKFRRAFEEGRDWTYGILDATESRVIGGSGLHPRTQPGRLEIGYWIRSSDTGQGFATEVAAALADRAFHLHGADGVEIRCDPRNARSAAVPQRLGFTLERTLVGDTTAPDGSARDTQVWLLHAPRAAT